MPSPSACVLSNGHRRGPDRLRLNRALRRRRPDLQGAGFCRWLGQMGSAFRPLRRGESKRHSDPGLGAAQRRIQQQGGLPGLAGDLSRRPAPAELAAALQSCAAGGVAASHVLRRRRSAASAAGLCASGAGLRASSATRRATTPGAAGLATNWPADRYHRLQGKRMGPMEWAPMDGPASLPGCGAVRTD